MSVRANVAYKTAYRNLDDEGKAEVEEARGVSGAKSKVQKGAETEEALGSAVRNGASGYRTCGPPQGDDC